MKLKKSANALVIVGGWNSRIFTPHWIKKYLFPGEQEKFTIEMQAPFSPGFNTQFVSPRVSSKEVRILLQENRLSFSPVENKDENFDRIQDLALQLADYLPHTPVTAYGVNFLFTEDHVNQDLIDFIRPKDLTEIGQFGASLTNEEYTRRLLLNDHTLNFTIGLKDENITFKFNFHSDIGDLIEFKEGILTTPILELKQEAEKFITEIYSLESKGGSE